jgi:uncharacterized protein (DUF697 family)
MADVINTLLHNLLLIVVVLCVVPMALTAVVGWLALRQLQRFFSADAGDMNAQFERLRARHPDARNIDLVHKVVRQQSMKCGLVGALTGLGGFLTLPIALPIDILLSMRIQAAMVQFIASAYGQHEVGQPELRLRSYLVMTGSVRASQSTFRFVMRVILRLMGKSFAKLVPFIGAIVGYVINYSIARATGNVALRWYAEKARKQLAESHQYTEEA